MSDKPGPAQGRQNRSFRIKDTGWVLFVAAASGNGTTASQLLRDFITAYIRNPEKMAATARRINSPEDAK